jgi:hypothetical protein
MTRFPAIHSVVADHSAAAFHCGLMIRYHNPDLHSTCFFADPGFAPGFYSDLLNFPYSFYLKIKKSTTASLASATSSLVAVTSATPAAFRFRSTFSFCVSACAHSLLAVTTAAFLAIVAHVLAAIIVF